MQRAQTQEQMVKVILDIEYHDTPIGWMACRPGLCWCEGCSRRNVKGFGVTKEEAAAELVAEEAERCDD